MPSDLLENIKIRIQQAAKCSSFPDEYINELCSHDNRWGSDICVKVTNPINPQEKTWQTFKFVRVWHRIPNNNWIFGGGFRYHPNVTLSMMESHAIEMSFKSWIMGIPHGGAKGGIALDPRMYSHDDLIAITCKAVDKALEHDCIGPYRDRWAPDVGTNETIMQWIQDHYAYKMREQRIWEPAACVTGKPLAFGGMPWRKEATGRALHEGLKVFRNERAIILPEHPTAILEGFGNVGYHFARFCQEFGIKLIAVLDQYGGVHHPNLPLADLIAYVDANPRKTVAGFHEICGGDEIKNDKELFSIPADIAVPAALEEAITPDIASSLKIKVLLEGANGPTLPDADQILTDRGIEVIPDIYANAGGVLVSYFEWQKDTHIPPFDRDLRIPKEPDAELVLESMVHAFFLNGQKIIALRKEIESRTGTQINNRLASYVYAMERALPAWMAKRRKQIM